MARRREIQGVCNDLLESFVSRNNDIKGYWAQGIYQAHMCRTGQAAIIFPLIPVTNESEGHPFEETINFYRDRIFSTMEARKIPTDWLAEAVLVVHSTASNKLRVDARLISDLGHSFTSRKHVAARMHDERTEHRSRRWPSSRRS